MRPEPALAAAGLCRRFGGGRFLFGALRPAVHAVSDVSLDVRAGETLGIVGESGCGKSTLARLLVGLDRPDAGTLEIAGSAAAALDLRSRAQRIQYVFQDPMASLNPRKTIRQTLEAPMRRLLRLPAAERASRIGGLLDSVGLSREALDRYPHEFSGGQAQRIAIARALAAEAGILVLDEPVSALDVSVQAQVLNLLAQLQAERGLTYVFISHDLSVIESICDRVAVMYFGRIVELADAEDLYRNPRHPYTDLLIRSAPVPGRRRLEAERAAFELPDPTRPPPGCAFASRCPRAAEKCRAERPTLNGEGDAACWFPLASKPAEGAT